MTDQLRLDLPEVPVLPGTPTLAERALAFHRANPHILTALIAIADGLDTDRLSIKMLWEVLRYRMIETHGDAGYRLNNSFTATYGRLIAEARPDLGARLQFRVRPSEKVAA